MRSDRLLRLVYVAVIMFSSHAALVGADTGSGITAQQVSFDSYNGEATVRITNTSQKNISAYVFTYTVLYGPGVRDDTQRLIDLLPAITSRAERGESADAGSMRPGDTKDQRVAFAPRRGSLTATGLEVAVDLVEYTDGTIEGSSAAARRELRNVRGARAATLGEVIRIIHEHLDHAADHTDCVAPIVADLNVLLDKARRQPLNISDTELLSIIDDLQRFPKNSAESRHLLQSYVIRQERRAEIITKHLQREEQ